MIKHKVEEYIKEILSDYYGNNWQTIYNKSELIQYLNLKSGAIHGDSNSRRSLANWYAIYAILTFYKDNNFVNHKIEYLKFEGFRYTPLFEFTRNQYGGEKLQNHALNSRVNGEFKNKISSDKNKNLIVISDGKYFIHPDYLYIDLNGKEIDIVPAVLKIIKTYQKILYEKDNQFAMSLKNIKDLKSYEKQKRALIQLLNRDTEARVFEIMSYAILECHFKNTKVYIGLSKKDIKEKYLQIYKTGRTNANDGGIDFVMRPLGRFFQVTEVSNYDKYFLDIDKVNHYPITFVVKTSCPAKKIYTDLINYGDEKSGGLEVLKNKYHSAIEEVITINELVKWMSELNNDDVQFLVSEIDRYFKLEMNIVEVN